MSSEPPLAIKRQFCRAALLIAACVLADGYCLWFAGTLKSLTHSVLFVWIMLSQPVMLAAWAVFAARRGPWRLVLAATALGVLLCLTNTWRVFSGEWTLLGFQPHSFELVWIFCETFTAAVAVLMFLRALGLRMTTAGQSSSVDVSCRTPWSIRGLLSWTTVVALLLAVTLVVQRQVGPADLIVAAQIGSVFGSVTGFLILWIALGSRWTLAAGGALVGIAAVLWYAYSGTRASHARNDNLLAAYPVAIAATLAAFYWLRWAGSRLTHPKWEEAQCTTARWPRLAATALIVAGAVLCDAALFSHRNTEPPSSPPSVDNNDPVGAFFRGLGEVIAESVSKAFRDQMYCVYPTVPSWNADSSRVVCCYSSYTDSVLEKVVAVCGPATSEATLVGPCDDRSSPLPLHVQWSGDEKTLLVFGAKRDSDAFECVVSERNESSAPKVLCALPAEVTYESLMFTVCFFGQVPQIDDSLIFLRDNFDLICCRVDDSASPRDVVRSDFPAPLNFCRDRVFVGRMDNERFQIGVLDVRSYLGLLAGNEPADKCFHDVCFECDGMSLMNPGDSATLGHRREAACFPVVARNGSVFWLSPREGSTGCVLQARFPDTSQRTIPLDVGGESGVFYDRLQVTADAARVYVAFYRGNKGHWCRGVAEIVLASGETNLIVLEDIAEPTTGTGDDRWFLMPPVSLSPDGCMLATVDCPSPLEENSLAKDNQPRSLLWVDLRRQERTVARVALPSAESVATPEQQVEPREPGLPSR